MTFEPIPALLVVGFTGRRGSLGALAYRYFPAIEFVTGIASPAENRDWNHYTLALVEASNEGYTALRDNLPNDLSKHVVFVGSGMPVINIRKLMAKTFPEKVVHYCSYDALEDTLAGLT